MNTWVVQISRMKTVSVHRLLPLSTLSFAMRALIVCVVCVCVCVCVYVCAYVNMFNISFLIVCCILEQLCGVIFAFRLHATRQLQIICSIIYAFKIFFLLIYTQSREQLFSLVYLPELIRLYTVKLETEDPKQ